MGQCVGGAWGRGSVVATRAHKSLVAGAGAACLACRRCAGALAVPRQMPRPMAVQASERTAASHYLVRVGEAVEAVPVELWRDLRLHRLLTTPFWADVLAAASCFRLGVGTTPASLDQLPSVLHFLRESCGYSARRCWPPSRAGGRWRRSALPSAGWKGREPEMTTTYCTTIRKKRYVLFVPLTRRPAPIG